MPEAPVAPLLRLFQILKAALRLGKLTSDLLQFTLELFSSPSLRLVYRDKTPLQAVKAVEDTREIHWFWYMRFPAPTADLFP